PDRKPKINAHCPAAPARSRPAALIAATRAAMNMPVPIPRCLVPAGTPNATPTDPAVVSLYEENMRHKLITHDREKTWAVVFETGEEVISRLQRFCEEQNLSAARFSAIGAFSAATLGYFDWQRKDYEKIPVNEQVEVLSLLGDVALYEDTP